MNLMGRRDAARAWLEAAIDQAPAVSRDLMIEVGALAPAPGARSALDKTRDQDQNGGADLGGLNSSERGQ
jgi:hypothetical protein